MHRLPRFDLDRHQSGTDVGDHVDLAAVAVAPEEQCWTFAATQSGLDEAGRRAPHAPSHRPETSAAGSIVRKLEPPLCILLTEEQADALSAAAKQHVDQFGYLDSRSSGYVLCGDGDRFTSRANDANCRFFGAHSLAIRDIHAGEEITDEYAELGERIGEGRHDIEEP